MLRQVSADCVMGKVASRASLNGCADGIEVFGSPSDDILVYSNYCGRIRMHNVKVENRGIDWDAPDNCYWGHRVARKESCQIVLHGNAEFEALDCALKGNCFFEVPDGHRLRVTSGPDGLLVQEMELLAASPSWYWRCSLTDDAARIVLEMHSAIPLEKSF